MTKLKEVNDDKIEKFSFIIMFFQNINCTLHYSSHKVKTLYSYETLDEINVI